MHKKFYERVRDYFINMGKHHRILLPIAVVGLALTMLITNICIYFKQGTKRIACAVFVLCLFFLGSSFAFPYLNLSNGFISQNEDEEEISAEDSDIALSEGPSDEESTALNNPNISAGESGEAVDMTDTYYLDDILADIDVENTAKVSEEENEPTTERFSSDDWKIILINKQHPIPENYEFELGTIKGALKCDDRILDDLILMLKDAQEAGLDMMVASPYRASDRQEYLFDRKIDQYMKGGTTYMEAYKFSSQTVTVPGASEHQVGLAIDFNSTKHPYLDEAFADTPEGMWLNDNCSKYGFIIRYPKNKEYITSIEYEPWHLRYVGKDAATIIMSEGICLEEFWDRFVE